MSNKKPNNRKFIFIGILVVIGLVLKFTYFSKSFYYSGTLEATKLDLSSRLSSVISEIKVNEGDIVGAHQILLSMLCDDVKVNADLANSNFERNKKLFQAGTVSPETLEQIKNKKSESDIHMSWCNIESPLSATVLNRYHEPGEWVTPGTKLFTIADIKDIWTTIYIPQTEVYKLKPGQKLKGHLAEMKEREFEGTVLKINSEAEFTPKNVQTESERSRLVFGAKVSFKGSNQDEILKPGMTIEVELPK